MISILSALEAFACPEVLVGVTSDCNKRAFWDNTFGEKLIAAHMVAPQKLLHAPKEGTFLLFNVVGHWFIATGLIGT
jgi:hypothetical protein